MEAAKLELYNIASQLDELYDKANEMMSRETPVDVLRPILNKVNFLSAHLDKLLINVPSSSDSVEKKAIVHSIEEQWVKRGQFDSRVSEYIQSAEPSTKNIVSVVSGSRTLRSRLQSSRLSTHSAPASRPKRSSCLSSVSSSSSVVRAKSVAMEESARMKLEHLKVRQELERKAKESLRKLEEEREETKQRLEILQASQELEQASLERQVIEEELEHGGYLPIDVNFEGDVEHSVSQTAFQNGLASREAKGTFAKEMAQTDETIPPTNQQATACPQPELQVKPSSALPEVKKGSGNPKSSPVTGRSGIKSQQEVVQKVTTRMPEESSCNQASERSRIELLRNRAETEQGESTHSKLIQQAEHSVGLNVPGSSVTHNTVSGSMNQCAMPTKWTPMPIMDFPKIEILKFSGDPLDFVRFMKTFELNVESLIQDSSRCLLLLIQHCDGEAKKLIEFCLLLDPDEGYRKAKDILKENFGRKNVIARAHMERLHSEVNIKNDDERGLVKLAHDLEECELIFKELNLHSDINNFESIAKIVRRLPHASQTRWVKVASKIEKIGQDPTFNDLVNFMKGEAEVSRSAYAKVLTQRHKRVNKFSTNMTSVSEETQGNGNPQSKKCSLCSGEHILWDCSGFKSKPVNERVAFMRQNHLCDNCCKKGHIGRFCRKDGMCTVTGCRWEHHSLLHQARNGNNTSATSKSPATTSNDDRVVESSNQGIIGMTGAIQTDEGASKAFLNVVLVRVSVGETFVDTLAFLDQGSTTTLCDERLLDKLGVTGERARYSITTINQTKECRSGRKAQLSVSSVQGGEKIELANVYCVSSLPVLPNPTLTEDELQNWPHLSGVDIPTQQDGTVMLLIGVDNPEVFWTIDERHGKRGQPYAIKTVLGWSLIGCGTRSSN